MSRTNNHFIVCPTCGAEYMPSEIFVYKYFINNTYNISKDLNGKILYYDGKPLITDEKYMCDYCNTSFNIHANVNFVSNSNKNVDFDSDYKCAIKTKLKLKED